jgi:hypothetical protein
MGVEPCDGDCCVVLVMELMDVCVKGADVENSVGDCRQQVFENNDESEDFDDGPERGSFREVQNVGDLHFGFVVEEEGDIGAEVDEIKEETFEQSFVPVFGVFLPRPGFLHGTIRTSGATLYC